MKIIYIIALRSAILGLMPAFFPILNAQVKTIAFREFDSEEFLSNSLSLDERGILMYGMENSKSLTLSLLNKELVNERTWNISLEKWSQVRDIVYIRKYNTVAILLVQNSYSFKFVTLKPEDKKFKITDIEIPRKTRLTTGMLVVDDEVWLGAVARKEGHMLFRIPIESPRINPVNIDLARGRSKFSVKSIQVLDNDDVAVVYHYGPKKVREMDVTIISKDRKILYESLLSALKTEQRAQLLDASVTWLGSGDYSLTGTYHKMGKAMIGNGVFFARFTNEKIRYLSLFDYSDFEHFNDWMVDKQQERVEKQIARKKAKGKEVTLSRLSVQHPAKVVEGGLLFVAEYFYPTYRTETRTTYVNGRPTTTTQRIFDGYSYTNGMAVGISHDGAKLFDLNIPLSAPYKPFEAKKFLHLTSDSSVVRLLYTSGRKVLSSVIDGSSITNNEWAVTHTIPEGQREKWTSSASMHWYGNIFFILEMQKTKEKGLLKKGQKRFYGAAVEVN